MTNVMSCRTAEKTEPIHLLFRVGRMVTSSWLTEKLTSEAFSFKTWVVPHDVGNRCTQVCACRVTPNYESCAEIGFQKSRVGYSL